MQPIRSHKDLTVWQKSIDLTELVYKLTDEFPQREIYALSSQMRRAVVSIASNIAEGRARRTKKDFIHFLHMAFGSTAELETQLLIAKRLGFCTEHLYPETDQVMTEVSKMLRAMIEKLEANS